MHTVSFKFLGTICLSVALSSWYICSLISFIILKNLDVVFPMELVWVPWKWFWWFVSAGHNKPRPTFTHTFSPMDMGLGGVGNGQGGLACCSSWGRKELDTTERLSWTQFMDSHVIYEIKIWIAPAQDCVWFLVFLFYQKHLTFNEFHSMWLQATRTQAPPTPLIFSSALLLKNFAFTMTGCFGSFPFPRTL